MTWPKYLNAISASSAAALITGATRRAWSRASSSPAVTAATRTTAATLTAFTRHDQAPTRCPECATVHATAFHACHQLGPLRIGATSYASGLVVLDAAPLLYLTFSPALGRYFVGRRVMT